jgi:adenine-specific DNA-methyltransferase
LIDKILSAKKKDPQVNTSELEDKIDEMVYKLYDLTPAEIAIVKGK